MKKKSLIFAASTLILLGLGTTACGDSFSGPIDGTGFVCLPRTGSYTGEYNV